MKSKTPNIRQSIFSKEFREDLAYWVKTDRKVALHVLDIVEAVMRNSFDGIGKPEPLCYLGSGIWSRRLTQEHRVVYVVSENRINFIQCRYHY